MRGHIKQRSKKKGTWSIILELDKDAATGKRRQQWLTVQGSKRDAEKKLAELLHQKDNGTYVRPVKLTIGEYLEQWLRDYQTNLAQHTVQSYQFFISGI